MTPETDGRRADEEPEAETTGSGAFAGMLAGAALRGTSGPGGTVLGGIIGAQPAGATTEEGPRLMRRTGTWMQQLDERLLEQVDEEGWTTIRVLESRERFAEISRGRL